MHSGELAPSMNLDDIPHDMSPGSCSNPSMQRAVHLHASPAGRSSLVAKQLSRRVHESCANPATAMMCQQHVSPTHRARTARCPGPARAAAWPAARSRTRVAAPPPRRGPRPPARPRMH
jgi:hypothetical protein